MIRVSAVIVQMTMVSTKISPHAHALWRTGWSVLAGACRTMPSPVPGVVGIHPACEAVADRVADGGARKAADAGDRGKAWEKIEPKAAGIRSWKMTRMPTQATI